MKKLFVLLFSLKIAAAAAQTIETSDETFVGNAEGYGIIGKYNDRVLFFILDHAVVKTRAYDSKMRKLWERELEPDRKNSAVVLEVVGSRQDFNVVYQFRRKNHNYIKIHKYDGQAKLLDSTTVYDWGKNTFPPLLKSQLSEDKKAILIYEIEDNRRINAIAVSLDSLRPIWQHSFDEREWYDEEHEHFKQIVFNNRTELYIIREEDNRPSVLERHHFKVKKYTPEGDETTFALPLSEAVTFDVKFSFDNANQKLVAAGLYNPKSFARAEGYFFFALPPQYADGMTFLKILQPFDNEFVASVIGKKASDVKNRGLVDLKVQEIVHRRDGGILAIVEQVRIVERRSSSVSSRYLPRGSDIGLSATDYYYDNVLAISLAVDGTTHWKSVFYKKQMSQDDDARYASYFLVKTPAALRFLFNEEIERATTVSEYVLNGSGASERHAILNTEGQALYLRFRDALQVGANEIIVPSDDHRRVKLLRIQY